jgi:hypothetical protein
VPPDLAGIPDSEDLQKLPEADRVSFEKLWGEVNNLLEKL